MTDNEFTVAFWDMGGRGRQLRRSRDGERLVYVIADALDVQAKRVQKNGRPDRAGRLRYISTVLRYGRQMTKGPVKKARRDLDEVRDRLVDGVSDAGL